MRPVTLTAGGRRVGLEGISLPLDLDGLVPREGPWEVEIGFGKGRYLLRRAAETPDRRFLGIEMAAKYYRLVERRVERRGLANTALILGEALYVIGAVLPRAFARVVHVYFPDPWPKDRHHKRRLFDAETVDLLLNLLQPGGELCFATDFLEYGERVARLLESHPLLEVERLEAWPEGPRTNYEIKFVRAGRPILRLRARPRGHHGSMVHPEGRLPLAVASRERPEPEAP